MFYTNKILFIHIPRTGGTWLTEWAKQNLDCCVDTLYLKHVSYLRLLQTVPELYSLIPFYIERDEQQRVDSFYNLALTHQANPSPYYLPEWQYSLNQLSVLEREEWIKRYYAYSNHYIRLDSLHFPFEKNLVSCISWLKEIHQLT